MNALKWTRDGRTIHRTPIWIYEAATSDKGNQTHAMTRVAVARTRAYGIGHHGSALCGTLVQPIGSEFDQSSAYACGNCKRVIASGRAV